jgi:GTP-binding protein HflX
VQGTKPGVMIFNKTDAYSYVKKEEDDLTPETKENYSLEYWKNTWMSKEHKPALFISAKKKTNIDDLKNLLYDEVKKIHAIRYPYNEYLY